jgi:peptide deformylase
MAVRPIVKWPDSRLREKTHEVPEITDEIRQLYRDLCDTMFADNGVGIAAIQIGHPAKMFLIEAMVCGRAKEDPPLAFINPEIVELSEETEVGDEGCLSFPGIYVPIARAVRARVRATGIDGAVFELEGTGLCARAMQHENDHLTGKLLVDFVGPLKKQMIKRKMKRLAAEEAEEADAADASGAQGG